MGVEQLRVILNAYRKVGDAVPEESMIRGLLNQSMVIGIDASVSVITGLHTWQTALPYLQDAIKDIPPSQNAEIGTEVFNQAEELWPNFISSLQNSTKKRNHVGKMLTKLIKEIRDAPTN